MNPDFRFCIVFFFFLSHLCFGQQSADYRSLSDRFAGERAVVLQDRDHIHISLTEGRLSIGYDRYSETMYLDNMAGLFSEHSIEYSEFDNIVSIEAATLIPDKNKFREIKVKDFTHKEKLSRSVFFDGSKTVSFLFPKLEQGTKSYVKYKKQITEPRFLPSFYFQRGIPVLKAEFSITVCPDVEIDWKLINMDEKKLSFTTQKDKSNNITYTWTMHDIEKLVKESDAPDARYYTPHILTWIKSYKTGGKNETVLGSTQELYTWYHSLVKDANKEDSEELKKITDSLKAGSASDLETVRKVFYWVQDNIKYIAIEDGMGGFVPRSARAVCEKRYGDCKDMSSIIQKMLEYAGIPSYLTWIGSRDIPYAYSEVATPSVDNHMICTYIHGNRYYFLDATGQYTPFGMPTAFIQGKEALIGIDSNTFIVHKVPLLPADESRITDSVNIQIAQNKILGKGKSSLSGYAKINSTYTLSTRSGEWSKVLRDFYNKGNNKFLIDSLEIKNLYNRDQPLSIEYTFNIDDYIKHAGNELYINMHLSKLWQTSSIKKDRKYPMDLENTQQDINIVTLEIPNGYSLRYIPDNISFANEGYGFDIAYRKVKNGIEMTRTIYTNTLLLKTDSFESWNSMIKELNKAYSEVVVLNKL